MRLDPASWLAAIVASSDDAIISKDLNGIIQTWNRGAERIFGYTAEEAIGRPITIIIPADRLHEEDTVLSQVRAGLIVDHFETVRRRKDGTPVDISLTVSPVHEGERIVGASKIARDITEQRRLREEIENANRLKDEFLAILSHELRTPLNAVVGYTSMLRKELMDEQQRARALDVIYRNAEALTRLVGDLLDTSRIITGHIRLEVRPFDLSALIVEAVENIRPSADAKGIALTETVPKAVAIYGDRDRLRQVMWNLLTNAVKFTPSGGRIAVELSCDVDDMTRVSVRDTGIGVPPDALPHLFERFWQAESGKSRDHGGLGLGLALSRNFVELHGGRIGAKSGGIGLGTEIWVELPRRAVAEAEAGEHEAPDRGRFVPQSKAT
jgi:PAS domain S-box-containing protein